MARDRALLLAVLLAIGAHHAHAAQGLSDERREVARLLQRFRRRLPHRAPLARQHEPGERHEDQDHHREARIHVEHGGDQDDDLEIVLAERDEGAARRGADQRRVVEEARQQPSRMHRLDEAEIGAGELGEHLDAQIGDEAVAEIVHRHVADIFGDRLDDGHHHDGGGDEVDHLLVLGDEHVVGRPLDEERNGAGRGGGQDHGDAGDQQDPDPRAQMLAPDAHHDLLGRVLDLKLVPAPGDGADVPEQLIFQALPRFFDSLRDRTRQRRRSSSTRPLLALRRKTRQPLPHGLMPRRPLRRGRAAGADAR